MNYKITDGMKISDIILGGDYIGTLVDKKTTFDMLDAFFENGGTCIDTANLYTNGLSEETFGEWLKSRGRDKMYISTKGGHPNPNTMNVSRLSESELEFDLNTSLKRLKTDYTDIYFLHRDDPKKPVGEIIETLNKFVKQGKIKSLGASNWTSRRIAEANSFAKQRGLKGFSFSQIKYSLAQTSPDYKDDQTLVEMNNEEYDFYEKEKISVFAFAPQGKGFFSKLALGEQFLSPKAKERYYCPQNLKRFKAVCELKEKYNCSEAAIALAFITSDKSIKASAIAGAKNKNQLLDCLSACSIALASQETEYLKSL